MTEPTIDRATFDELQGHRRRRLRRASWSTRSSRKRRDARRAARRAARQRDADALPPRRAFAQVERQHLRRAAPSARWRASSSSAASRAVEATARRSTRWRSEYARVAAALTELRNA